MIKLNKLLPKPEYLLINNQFSVNKPLDWEDKTSYILEGPGEDGMKHNIIINIDHNIDISDVVKFAEINISSLKQSLLGYTELKRSKINLNNNLPGYDLIYKWSPVKGVKVFQRIVYLLFNKKSYILTATFTKKSFKIIGPEVDKILMSFQPKSLTYE